jgi:hypothetical protein
MQKNKTQILTLTHFTLHSLSETETLSFSRAFSSSIKP